MVRFNNGQIQTRCPTRAESDACPRWFGEKLILTARRDPYPEVTACGRGLTLPFATSASMPDISIYLVWDVASGVEGEVWQGLSIWQGFSIWQGWLDVTLQTWRAWVSHEILVLLVELYWR